MTGYEEWAARCREAHTHVKSARRKLEKVIVHEIGDARADEPLIELRKALAYFAEIIEELPH
ncbi:hypothetical protein [Bradyrhizobium sp. 27S5]|uniref:hypothetical protein n=1 Tax=Bradyrhizobium sp. 27S5 TaxID=3139728 RepID=UPI0030CD0AF5